MAVTGLGVGDVRRFGENGYLVVPGVVPEALLAAADDEVDALVATEPTADGQRGPGWEMWFPPVARLPRCEALLRGSPALGLASSLVAPAALDHRFDHIQVATTVPPYAHVPGGPHIDGHGPGQVPPASFTLLAGVLLTDQLEPDAGGLWVWPGSHIDHARLFRERGTDALSTTGGHATLLDPPPPLGPAVPVLGRRGDLVLAHFLLGHNKGGNTTDAVRRTVYFRLAVPGHAERWEATFLDPWTEYAPVAAALG